MFRLFLCLVFLAMPAHAVATKPELIERLFDVTHLETMSEKSADAVFSTLKTPESAPVCYKEAEPKIIVMAREATSFEKLKPFLVQSYSEVFTEEELQKMIEFYATPAGQKTLEKMPLLQQKAMLQSQATLKALMPEIQRVIQESCGEK
jgi:hypothetical protein